MITVTHEQAEMCAEFLAGETDDFAAPLSVLDATDWYVAATKAGDLHSRNNAIRAMRRALESWMAMDRKACVGLLGPGLGVEQ